jgi:hypothetical protein
MGVLVRRAAGILALGMVFGMLVGGVATASAITLSLRDRPPAAAAVPLAAVTPSARPTAAPTPSAPAFGPAVPKAALSALSGTAVVNGQIATDADALARTLATKGSTANDVARALRSLAADAALGIDLTDRMAGWPDGSKAAVKLAGFYRSMAATARDGLRASLTDDASYRSAAAKMLVTLGTLGDVDATSRALAESVGLVLPTVLPKASSKPDASSYP